MAKCYHKIIQRQITIFLKLNLGLKKDLNVLPQKFKAIFIKFRTANHNLSMENGRWCGIPKLERTCHVCNRGQIAVFE